MYSFSWCYRPGSCHNVQCTWTASPHLSCVISAMSVICVHLDINQRQQQLGLPEARSWAAPWQGRLYSTSWQAVRPTHRKCKPSPSPQHFPPTIQGRTLCWVNSLRPSASVVQTLYDLLWTLRTTGLQPLCPHPLLNSCLPGLNQPGLQAETQHWAET